MIQSWVDSTANKNPSGFLFEPMTPTKNPESTKGFLLDEFYFTTVERKFWKIADALFRISWMTNLFKIQPQWFVLSLQFCTGLSNFCEFPEIVSRLPSVGGKRQGPGAENVTLKLYWEYGRNQTYDTTMTWQRSRIFSHDHKHELWPDKQVELTWQRSRINYDMTKKSNL